MPNIEPEPLRGDFPPARSPLRRADLAPEKPRDRFTPRLPGRAAAIACASGRSHQLCSSFHPEDRVSTASIHPDRINGAYAPAVGAWVTAVELDGETVLYDETSGVLHLLDAVATVVWARLDGTATLDELTADLSRTFATDPARVRGDLVAFARQLGRQHLLEGVALPPVDDDDG